MYIRMTTYPPYDLCLQVPLRGIVKLQLKAIAKVHFVDTGKLHNRNLAVLSKMSICATKQDCDAKLSEVAK